EHALRVGNHSQPLELSSLEEPVSHRADGATILSPYVHLSIHNEPCDSLARTSVLHARFHRIDGKSRTGDGLVQPGARFPFVCLTRNTPSYAWWKIGL